MAVVIHVSIPAMRNIRLMTCNIAIGSTNSDGSSRPFRNPGLMMMFSCSADPATMTAIHYIILTGRDRSTI
jgi:hypothetical protein